MGRAYSRVIYPLNDIIQCTNCASACKRCDVSRPCERCIKYGLSDTCRDGQRKERKKGFKRGPYNKRKRQEEREAHEWEGARPVPPSSQLVSQLIQQYMF